MMRWFDSSSPSQVRKIKGIEFEGFRSKARRKCTSLRGVAGKEKTHPGAHCEEVWRVVLKIVYNFLAKKLEPCPDLC